jgi:MFS family permease
MSEQEKPSPEESHTPRIEAGDDSGGVEAGLQGSIPPPLDGEAHFHSEVQRSLKRNVTAHMLHGMLGQTGFRIVDAPTLVPAYVYMLSGSTTAVGIARACQALGTLLTPIVGATLIEHRKRVLPMVFGTGAGMRLPLLGIALSGFLFDPQITLWSLCVLMAIYGFFQGMQMVTFSVLVSKVIPVERRGALVGRRNTVAGLAASSVALFSGSLIERNVFGNGYATTFLVAFVLTALGLLSLVLVHEPESFSVRTKSQQLGARLRELPILLAEDPAYRGYMLARAIGTMGRMAVPYYVIYASKVMHMPGEKLGALTAAFLLAQTVSSMVWGELGDRRGFRAVLLWALGIWTIATILLTYSTTLNTVMLGFIGLGVGLGGFQLGTTNLVLEFGQRKDLPMRIALAQTFEQMVVVIAPLLGSALIQGISYEAMFWTAAALQSVALLVTWLRVQDPRRRAT